MNEIANKFLLAGDKCVPGIHLKQSGFAYSGFGQLTKNKERIQKITKKTKQKKTTGDTIYIYRNEVDKTCFQHDKAQENFKDLGR